MEDLAALRDEVYEPLGLLPVPELRPAARIGWKIAPLAAPVVVAIAMAAFTFGRHYEPPRAEPLAARTAPPAQAAPAPPPSPAPAGADKPGASPIAASDRIDTASGVKVLRQGAPSAPTPLIIDVQQALAAEKAKAEPLDLR